MKTFHTVSLGKSVKNRLQLMLAALVMGGTLASGCKPSLSEDENWVTQRRRFKKSSGMTA